LIIFERDYLKVAGDECGGQQNSCQIVINWIKRDFTSLSKIALGNSWRQAMDLSSCCTDTGEITVEDADLDSQRSVD
jgi:hypothetical protein